MERLILFVLLLWLAGCASTPPGGPAQAGSAAVYRQSAEQALNAGDYRRAVSLAERGLRMNRYAGDLYLLLAQAYQALDNREQSLNFARLGLRYAGEDETLRTALQVLVDAGAP